METLEIVLRILLVVDAIALIVLVLLQQGKGASMGAAFGSGASQTMFGSAGANSFLTKVTAWLAVGFFVITLALAWTARERALEVGNIGIPAVEDVDVPPVEDAPRDPPASPDDVPFTFDAEPGDADDEAAADVPELD
ncbi:MAG: preprotein translocase subunit SecG [Gammaproteobacteria bacterium]|nr:preprotein translocase subunit SecG [Gammaproteobacteria bacterium]